VSLIHTAEMNGLKTAAAFLTRTDIPIGRGIWNWLEVKECIDMMKDGGKGSNLRLLVLCEAAQMLQQSGQYGDKYFDQVS
jgi:thymidine phosphorylase